MRRATCNRVNNLVRLVKCHVQQALSPFLIEARHSSLIFISIPHLSSLKPTISKNPSTSNLTSPFLLLLPTVFTHLFFFLIPHPHFNSHSISNLSYFSLILKYPRLSPLTLSRFSHISHAHHPLTHHPQCNPKHFSKNLSFIILPYISILPPPFSHLQIHIFHTTQCHQMPPILKLHPSCLCM